MACSLFQRSNIVGRQEVILVILSCWVYLFLVF